MESNLSPKKDYKKRAILILILIGITLAIMVVSLLLASSSNSTNSFWGTLFGMSIMAVILLTLGVIQFIPSIFRRRSRIKAILLWVMGLLWILVSGFLLFGLLPNYYEDISNALNARYTSYEGILTDYSVSHSSRSVETYLAIGDKKFYISGEYKPGVLIKGEKYRIEYLPHSKYVMHLYK